MVNHLFLIKKIKINFIPCLIFFSSQLSSTTVLWCVEIHISMSQGIMYDFLGLAYNSSNILVLQTSTIDARQLIWQSLQAVHNTLLEFYRIIFPFENNFCVIYIPLVTLTCIFNIRLISKSWPLGNKLPRTRDKWYYFFVRNP